VPARYRQVMPRMARAQPGGVVFHVLHRGHDRREWFGAAADDAAFLRVLAGGDC